MGSKWFTGGVVAAANGRIQFDFMFKKTYNNAISILRRAFEFGYQGRPNEYNPARGLGQSAGQLR